MTYRPEIDGLRAIAILAIVLFHAFGIPTSGFVGVDIFFVISGYLITRLMLDEHEKTGRINIVNFYGRRVRRIVPAATAVEIAVVIASFMLPESPQELSDVIASAAAAAIFCANLFFQSKTGYFSPNADQMPLLHLWSLSVEEQFYLVWPLLLMGILRITKDRLTLTLSVIALSSLALSIWLLHYSTNQSAAFFQMPARFWELSVGGVIASTRPGRKIPSWVATFAITLLAESCFFPFNPFPGDGALFVIASTALLVLCVHRTGTLGFAGSVLRSKPMVSIGTISYSFYLWHWPLLAFYRAFSVGQGSVYVRAALCVLSLAIAICSYRFIEQPFRFGIVTRRLKIASAVIMTLAIFAGGVTFILRQELQQAHEAAAHYAESDKPINWGACHYDLKNEQFPLCSFPGKKIAIWGDSMAMSWSPAFPNTATYTRDSCIPILRMPAAAFRDDERCVAWNQKVLPQIKTMKSVVIAGRWAFRARGREDAFAEEIRTTLSELSHLPDIRIILPTPEMSDSVPHCIRLAKLCDITRQQFDAETQVSRSILLSVAAPFPNVHFLDATDYLCDSEHCPGIKNGVALYFDSHHLAATAARQIVWN